jgi:peptide/nickel transport system ATP-binding protein
MPTLDLDRRADLATIPGAPPKLLELPPQCRFAPRCAFAQDDCRQADPSLVESESGHLHACFHPADESSSLLIGTERLRSRSEPEPGGSDTLVQLVDVHKKFGLRSLRPFGPKRAVHAVSGVTLSIGAGETFGIVGESGCGKTTIGRMLVGLERPSSGSVMFDGRDLAAQGRNVLRKRRRDLQMMFQDSAAALDPRMTVAALIEEPLVAQGIGTRRERRKTVSELLDAVGLPPEAAQRYAHEFSGGQRQRIAMARALALRPKVIVADEPVSALDVSVQAQILNLMRSLQDRYGQTYVVISHDLSLLKYLADRIGVMYLGRLVELGASEDVYSAPRHPYTAGLIKAIPAPESAKTDQARSVGLGGELPSAIDPPSGCHFRTRCPLATDRCAEEVPALAATDGLHAVACHHPLTTTELLTTAR